MSETPTIQTTPPGPLSQVISGIWIGIGFTLGAVIANSLTTAAKGSYESTHKTGEYAQIVR
jgi:hypothetical protein